MTRRGQDITLAAPDGPADAYLTGAADGSEPGVLLFVDGLGLRPRIHEIADEIAGWGYTVLAPHLFYRVATAAELAPTEDLRDPAAMGAHFGRIKPVLTGLSTAESDADTPVWIDYLATVATAPFGVTGYCLGARLAIRAAALAPDQVVAVGGFHGSRFVADAPDSTHLLLPATRASYVLGHADQDAGNPPEMVAALGAALDDAGLTHLSAIYPGAHHGFTMSDTPAWNAEACARHFTELRGLFDGTLRG